MSSEPLPEAEPFGWSTVMTLVGRHRRAIVQGQLLALLAALAAVPVPLLLPLLVDEVLLGHPGPAVGLLNHLAPPNWQHPTFYILALVVMTMLLRFLTAAFSIVQTRIFGRLSKAVVFDVRQRLLNRLEGIAMAEYDSLGTGAILTHLVADLDTLDQFIGMTVGRCLVALLTLLGTAGVLLWMNWQLGLVILLLNPLIIVLTRQLGGRVKQLKRLENAALGRFQSQLSETLEGIHQIRASNRENHYFSKVRRAAATLQDHAARYLWQSDAASRMSFLVFLTGFDAFRGLALLMVVFTDLSVGEMMAVSGYLWFMMTPVQELLQMQYGFYSAQAAIDRIRGFEALQQEPVYSPRADPFRGKTTVGVRIENLSFRYPDGTDVLREITVAIRPGERVALVGASGGGKSTLVQLLIGFYPPSAGRVLFDGVPFEAIGMKRVREHVVTVLQHPVLFNDSIRANLSMGRLFPDEALWQALDVAQLRPVIESHPQGLDAVVGRSGFRLSGGQRQRLAIARMLLQDPKVVILDEATSAVDTVTEARLYAALDTFLEGRTTLMVAHRLSAITHADRILVFEEGRLAEEGSHEALLSRQGLYARLYGARPRVRESSVASV